MSVVIVCGGRDYTNRSAVYAALDMLHHISPITLLIEGGAAGADLCGKQWAQDRGVLFHTEDADWDLHGKAAGPIRNKAMLDIQRQAVSESYETRYVVAFPGGKGTANMIQQARKCAGVWVIEIQGWKP